MLKNDSTGKIVCEKTKIAQGIFSKFRGLMLETRHDFALIFVLEKETIVGASIHMLFVFFPIDVVYLNKEKEIIELVQELNPWILNYSPKKPAKYFIELPNGTIREKNLKLGEKLDWVKN